MEKNGDRINGLFHLTYKMDPGYKWSKKIGVKKTQ